MPDAPATLSYEVLTPTAFLARSAFVYADKTAVIDGNQRWTYAEWHARCMRLAGALRGLGVQSGERVAVLAPNTHLLLEAHYGVPMAGAVLVALNMRLTADDLAYIIEHSGARVLIFDREFAATAQAIALKTNVRLIAQDEYEALIANAAPHVEAVTDERGLLSINYTSGTTGKPKGVMYHHRGAYLQALAMAAHTRMGEASVYLWTLPMFHCNGWCFTWAVTAAGATHLCLPKLEAGAIWDHLRGSGVTQLCAAPTVLIMLAWHDKAQRLQHPVNVATGGAPPTPALLARMAELNLHMTHLYGLTETFGPAVLCEWRQDWNAWPADKQAQIKARQGVGNMISQNIRVVDGEGRDVPRDGNTLGEIALRGNNVMLGYYRDDEATRKAAPDGWFRTGDLAVMHADGYLEVRDRAKDIIISGGENIASVEIERCLSAHPAVLEAAVVAMPDDKWGEVPVAFVSLKPAQSVTESALIAHARAHMAHFKAPKRIVFGDLPKNATGKIQKFVLRERARTLTAAI
jgi:fatty-acyl-CoA synthase